MDGLNMFCRKCGGGPVRGFYDSHRDRITYRCFCGFSWSGLPVDASEEKRKNEETRDFIVKALGRS